MVNGQFTFAEAQMAVALVENNISFAAADRLSPLFRRIAKAFCISKNKKNMHSEWCSKTLFQVIINT